MAGNCFAKIVDDQPGPDFLFNEPAFFGMKMNKINRVFEVPESSFLAPYADILEMPILFKSKAHA